MRRTLREAVYIAAPVDRVWALYDDPALLAIWAPSVRAARVIGGGPKQAGARVEVTLVFAGVEQRLVEEVVRHEPPHACTQRGRSPGMAYDMALTLHPERGGTWCEYVCAPRYEGLMRLLRPLGDLVNRGMLRSALRSLKAAAERPGDRDGAR
jgi:uncharacterized protein YndB with AHSA1/START domain